MSPILGVTRFSTDLRRSRRFIDLILGIPAALLLMLVGFTILSSRINTSEEASWYRTLADQAIEQERYEDAKIYLQRLVAIPSQRDRAQLGLASVLEEQGEPERAQLLLRALAPSDSHGLPEAHRARAILMTSAIDEETDAQTLREFRWHLAHSGDRSSLEIKRGWANYYLASGERKKSIKIFEELRRDIPEITSKLARLYLLDGKKSVATVYFEDALAHYELVLEKHPEETDARVEAIAHQLQLGRVNAAIRTIEQGIRVDPDGPFKKIMAEVQVVVHDAMVQDAMVQDGIGSAKKASLAQRLEQLGVALDYDPNCGVAIERLVAYSNAEVGATLSLKKIFSDAIAQGNEPALAHFAMAIVLWNENDLEQALWHLETSHQYAPDLPFVSNNLAWLLASRPNPDLDRALELASDAIELAPQDARYLDTRGTIYLQMEEWRLAIHDLELALQLAKARISIHEKLEKAYTGLGNKFMARAHHEIVEKLATDGDS